MAGRGAPVVPWNDVRQQAVNLLVGLRFPDESPIGPVFRIFTEALSVGPVAHAKCAFDYLTASVAKARFHFETKVRPQWKYFCHQHQLQKPDGVLASVFGIFWSSSELPWDEAAVREKLGSALDMWHHGLQCDSPFNPISGHELREWLQKNA